MNRSPAFHTHARIAGRDRAVCGALGGSSDPSAHVSCPKCNRATTQPCDEEDEHGNPVRTWDVWRAGRVVSSGHRTRIAARVYAAQLNNERTDQ